MRTAFWTMIALSCVGCSRPALRLNWVDEATLQYEPRSYPDDAAVVLHRSDHLLLVNRRSEDSYRQLGRHEVIALQKEGGFELAEVKLPFGATDKFIELKARLKPPNGPWEEVDPALLLSDTDGAGERDVNVRFFRFPRIEVGTLLEYYYVIESKGLTWFEDQDTVGQYPVRQYQFELEASKELVIAAIAYNSTSPIRSEVLPNSDNRLSSEIRDIPHRPKEDFVPHWTFTQPRWAWRLTAFDYKTRTFPGWWQWNDILKHTGAEYFGATGDLFKGYSATLDVSGCSDLACKVDRARAFVLANAKYKGGKALLKARPLKQVLEAKSATGLESALLMRRLLADVGVEARLAYATRHWSEQVDANFPGFTRFNEMLVYLPAQTGLPKGAWLLPRCHWCGLNELPSELRGVQVFVFSAQNLVVLDPVVESEWRSTGDAAPAEASRRLFHHEAQLTADGTLFDTFRSTDQGVAAEEEDLAGLKQTPADRLALERRAVSERAALGKLFEVIPLTCRTESGTCDSGKRFTIPVYATAENDRRWLVPLNALTLQYGTTLAPEKAQRVAALHFEKEYFLEEVFELEVPAGFSLESVPEPVSAKASLVETAVKVERTAKGARITRSLKQSIGGVPLAQYDEVRNAFRVFQDARHLVLSFVKR